ncbi:long-chain fatty acid--CoA ligase [Lichenibacterium dinghuense]|uniref:long-chain fatty acid--CoA ligase n=1 Tax=Lichenibacterium dinghuense TaxID=2895977 RepID=UPI001F259867|nr:long-chain fatty acid--CoA ligase [Lichenibacterium sp. 6Y81]
MRGLMMDVPLLVSSILRHAEAVHGDAEIASRDAGGGVERTTYADLASRSRRLARALDRLGLGPGDRVGTLAWNGARHLEVYFAASGSGRVCHTVNPRLFPGQIVDIVAHAGDAALFVDPGLVPLVESIADRLPALRAVVVLAGRDGVPRSERLPNLLCHDDLIAGERDDYAWPELDEREAAGLCYTSGTTGAPKGVLYSHRSTVLHALAISVPDGFGFAAADAAMPVVPMFHVNAWGLPYAAAMAGAKLVMPGPRLDGASLHGLIRDEGVTLTAGVPTVWMGLLDHVEARGETLAPLLRVGIGGSACPPAMIERFAALGVDVVHAWGMTETSPVAVVNRPKRAHAGLPREARLALGRKQGRPLFGVELRAVGPNGEAVPRDGEAFGAMLVRGPCVAERYYGSEGDEAFAEPGWFATGDIVTVDPDGFVEIVDRAKDVIKSGGEWISSIELENIAVEHPAVREAAVVARPDPRWGERPVLFVVLAEGAHFDEAAMAALFAGRVARWMVPGELRVVPDLPHTATGKLHKAGIRRML